LLIAQSAVQAADVAAITAWTTGTTGPSRFTAGSDRLLILTVGAEANSNVTATSATYGGRAMTQAATTSAGTGPYYRLSIFYLKEADIALATSNNFSVSWSGSTVDVHYSARMYSNVDQNNPIRNVATATTNLSTPNPIVTSSMTVVDGDMVVAAAGCGKTKKEPTSRRPPANIRQLSGRSQAPAR
jgi:hypothetical protein